MRATVCFPCSRLHPVSLGRRISEQKEGGLTSSRQRRATSRSHRCACALFPCPRRGPTSCSLSVRRAATILLIHAGPPGRCLYVPGSERRSQPCEQPRGRTRAKEERLGLTGNLPIEARPCRHIHLPDRRARTKLAGPATHCRGERYGQSSPKVGERRTPSKGSAKARILVPVLPDVDLVQIRHGEVLRLVGL